MRKLRFSVLMFFVVLVGAVPAQAQEWPQRPVRLLVGFGPGSTPDLMARLVAEHLQKQVGQPFVVENRAGAGGNIAADLVAKAKPDGYTLGATIPGPMIVNPMIMDLPYDPWKDLRPITIVATQPSVLVVTPALGVKNLSELIALLKKNPGKYNFASIGVGSISHLAMEMIALESGTEIFHLPYKASPEAIQAVITGEAHMAAMPPLAVLGHGKSGKLRLLAVTTPTRWPTLPDVPTFREAGLPEVQAEAWMALIAPRGVPDAIVERVYGALKQALSTTAAQEQIKRLAFEPVLNTPKEFEARLREEQARWRKVVDTVGLKKK